MTFRVHWSWKREGARNSQYDEVLVNADSSKEAIMHVLRSPAVSGDVEYVSANRVETIEERERLMRLTGDLSQP